MRRLMRDCMGEGYSGLRDAISTGEWDVPNSGSGTYTVSNRLADSNRKVSAQPMQADAGDQHRPDPPHSNPVPARSW